MEKGFVKMPFSIELAKNITSGKKEGKIVTRKGYPVKILTFDMANIDYPICATVLIPGVSEDCYHFAANGAHYKDFNPESNVDLMLEIPEVNTFTPGMPVLGFDGRGEWRYDIFSHIRLTTRGTTYYVCSGRSYKKIIPFAGNEHLAGKKDVSEG